MTRSGPLSPFQEVYWHAEQQAAGTFASIVRAFEVAGPLDLPALAAGVGALVARHGALRTRFQPGDSGVPVQVVEADVTTPLRVMEPVESRSSPPEFVEPELIEAELIEAELRTPFDLGRAPLLRVTVLRRAPEDHTLLLAVHHIICDGWSLRVLLSQLGDGYAAARPGSPVGSLVARPAPDLDYLDFVAWQRQESPARREAARAHWKGLLTPRPRPVDLSPGRTADCYQNARCRFRLGTGSASRLAEACRRLRVTPFIALLAGFKAALWLLSGQVDVAVGSLFAVRLRAEFEAMVGLLANATVLRTSLAGDPTYRELAGRVRAVVLGASDHQAVPIEEVAAPEDLRPAWSVWFNMLAAPTDELHLEGVAVRPRVPEPAATYVKAPPAWEGDSLAMTTWISAGEVRGFVDFNARLLDPATVDRLLAAFRSAVTTALTDPDQRLSDIQRRN